MSLPRINLELDPDMETPNVFSSELAIRNWFAAKTAPLEAARKHFNRCGKISFDPVILYEPCIYCNRKRDVLKQDIAYWNMRCDKELKYFRDGDKAVTYHVQTHNAIRNIYALPKGKIQKDIDAWTPLEGNGKEYEALEGLMVKEFLQKQRWKLEDWARQEDIEIQIADAKGWP